MRTIERYGHKKAAIRYKNLGIWEKYTWQDLHEKVKYFAFGLMSLGFKPRDVLCTVGDNEPELVFARYAAMAMGGVISGAYQTGLPEELKHQVDLADVTIMVVEDQEPVDKFLEIKDDLPTVKKVIYWDDRGLWGYKDEILMTFNQVLELGRELENRKPGLFEESMEKVQEDDVAVLTYTSGTTGKPKAGIWNHKDICWLIEIIGERFPYEDNEDIFHVLSTGHGAETLLFVLPAMAEGATLNLAEDAETVPRDMRELGWTRGIVMGVEVQSSELQVRISNSTYIKKLIYKLCLPVGYKRMEIMEEGKKLGPIWTALYWLAYMLLFRKIQDHYGYTRSKIALIGGMAFNIEAVRLFMAFGVPIINFYGSTENLMITSTKAEDTDSETCGGPYPGVVVRIDDAGEILVKNSPHISGYIKNPKAMAEAFDNEGWFHMGDAGFFTDDGRLVILDRISSLMTMKDGTTFPPLWIENKLKFSPYIGQAIAIGSDRDYVNVIIAIDYEYLGDWAEKRQIPYTSFSDLSQKPEVYDLILNDIRKRVNKTLSEGTKVKKFTILPKSLDADDAELTRTNKLRRHYVSEAYHDLIDAMYTNQTEFVFNVDVVYKDGRRANVKAPIKIVLVEEAEQ
ncbi:MAG: AMP-binding protein [Deltaproteobacteria bacterium]|nr:AMP-binding protein [Deltaproteobacteria bacterium]